MQYSAAARTAESMCRSLLKNQKVASGKDICYSIDCSYISVLYFGLRKEVIPVHSRKLAYTALFIAVGVLSAHLVYIPIGIAKCFPLQHVINILLAVLLGTRYSVSAAFGISVLRNILGTGSLLAFPGSMVGAALAGLLYKKTNSIWGAIIGEVIGTGFIGALLAYPVAKYFIGSQAGAFFFIIPFTVSTTGGSIIAYFLYKANIVSYLQYTLGAAESRNVAK